MPAFSGLYDDVFSDGPYASHSKPLPAMSGFLRVMLQKRGLYGWATKMGGTAPATRTLPTEVLPSLTVRGGYDYATRTNDPANQVVIKNAGAGGNRTFVAKTTLGATQPDVVALARVANITLNNEYAADESGNGGPALAQLPAEPVLP